MEQRYRLKEREESDAQITLVPLFSLKDLTFDSKIDAVRYLIKEERKGDIGTEELLEHGMAILDAQNVPNKLGAGLSVANAMKELIMCISEVPLKRGRSEWATI